jgi:hypothetical protein
MARKIREELSVNPVFSGYDEENNKSPNASTLPISDKIASS